MSMFKIEQNVPLPVRKSLKKYPFNEMKVGDSFLVNATDHPNVRSAAYEAGKALKRKFATRTSAEGCRVWRMK